MARAAVRRLGLVTLQCVIVLASIAITAVVALAVQERSIRSATEERVLDVAISLAELDEVQENVAAPLAVATARLQPLADTIAAASGVDYVVITDDEGIRITHPVAAERGRLVSTDPTPALSGETFVGTETGTIGPTLRAKAPVFDADGRVIGTVSVGILEAELDRSFLAAATGLLPWIIGAALLGSLAAAAVTGGLNRRVRTLEAQTVELGTQRRIAEALREQTHEFHTRMHVVRGLIAEGDDAASLAYLDHLVPLQDGGIALGIVDPRLRGVVDGLWTELREYGTTLGIDPESHEPAVPLPEGALTAIANFSRNAAEAGARTVRLRWDDTDGIRIDVDDDGPGLTPAMRERIFQRGETTKADPAGLGRGVGLTIVRREITDLGGTIEVGASPLGGARFSVVLPAAPRGERKGAGSR